MCDVVLVYRVGCLYDIAILCGSCCPRSLLERLAMLKFVRGYVCKLRFVNGSARARGLGFRNAERGIRAADAGLNHWRVRGCWSV